MECFFADKKHIYKDKEYKRFGTVVNNVCDSPLCIKR